MYVILIPLSPLDYPVLSSVNPVLLQICISISGYMESSYIVLMGANVLEFSLFLQVCWWGLWTSCWTPVHVWLRTGSFIRRLTRWCTGPLLMVSFCSSYPALTPASRIFSHILPLVLRWLLNAKHYLILRWA